MIGSHRRRGRRAGARARGRRPFAAPRSWRRSRRRTSQSRRLLRLARKGTTRAAPAAACRNLLLDEYLDADLAARCKQRYESYLLKRDGPRDLPAVTKEAKDLTRTSATALGTVSWLNVREFPVDLGRGLRERFSRGRRRRRRRR